MSAYRGRVTGALMKSPSTPRRRKVDDTTATMRRFAMLQAIPWEPQRVSTADMHRKLEMAGYIVDPRTVQRDLNTYSAHFHYSSEQRGTALYWFWPRHCQPLSVRAISTEAALILGMAEQHLQGLLPDSALELLKPYFHQARQTLTVQDPKGFSSWKDKVRVISRGPRFCVPQTSPVIQRAILEALLADRQLDAVYRSRGQTAAKSLVLHPLGIVSRDGMIYLVATAWDYSEPFQCALHRFERAKVATDSTRRPAGFDLERYVEAAREFEYPTGNGQIQLKIEIEASAAVSLLERPLSSDQTVRKLRNGRYRIEALVEDTLELRWWLLAFGANLEIIGPKRLRRDVGQALSEAARLYKSG